MSDEAKSGDNRGGPREGAGRPALEEGARRSERVVFRVRPDVAVKLDAHAREGESRNQTARRLLLKALE